MRDRAGAVVSSLVPDTLDGKTAKPLSLQLPIPAIAAASDLEPGVFGIWKPVLLLPEGITAHLTPEHLAAIVAHELCHVKRYDNLAAAAHMLVEALFWFHPMVWWIGARLLEERESACDEEVLRLGNRPDIYAESILKVCRLYLESPLVCVAGVTGAQLKRRLVRIMASRILMRLSLAQKVMLAALGTATLALPLSMGLTQVVSSDQRPTFDIISVKPSPPSSVIGTPFINDFSLDLGPGNHMTLQNVSLAFLLSGRTAFTTIKSPDSRSGPNLNGGT